MINYGKKAEIQPSAKDVEDNRFEQIRRAAAEKHRQLDTEAARRLDLQKPDDKRLLKD